MLRKCEICILKYNFYTKQKVYPYVDYGKYQSIYITHSHRPSFIPTRANEHFIRLITSTLPAPYGLQLPSNSAEAHPETFECKVELVNDTLHLGSGAAIMYVGQGKVKIIFFL